MLSLTMDDVDARIQEWLDAHAAETTVAFIEGMKIILQRPIATQGPPLTPATVVSSDPVDGTVITFDTDPSNTPVGIQTIVGTQAGQRGLVMSDPISGATVLLPFQGGVGNGVGPPSFTSILSGNGPPPDSTGSDGDWYIDLSADVLYGPKANGHWPTPGIQLGPGGSQNITTTGIFARNPVDYSQTEINPGIASIVTTNVASNVVTAPAGTFNATEVGMTFTALTNNAFPANTTVASVAADGSSVTLSQSATATGSTIWQIGKWSQLTDSYRLRASDLFVGHETYVGAAFASTALNSATANTLTSITVAWTDAANHTFGPQGNKGDCALYHLSGGVNQQFRYHYTVAANNGHSGSITLTVVYVSADNLAANGAPADNSPISVGDGVTRYDEWDVVNVRITQNNFWDDYTQFQANTWMPGPPGPIQIDGTTVFGPHLNQHHGNGGYDTAGGPGLNFSRNFQSQDNTNAYPGGLIFGVTNSDSMHASGGTFSLNQMLDHVPNHPWVAWNNGIVWAGFYSGFSFENFVTVADGTNVFGTGFQARLGIHNNVWATPPVLSGRNFTISTTAGSANITATAGTFSAFVDPGAGIQAAGLPPGARIKAVLTSTTATLNMPAALTASGVAAQVGAYVDTSLGFDYGIPVSRAIPFCKVTNGGQTLQAFTDGTYTTPNTKAFEANDIGKSASPAVTGVGAGSPGGSFGGIHHFHVIDVTLDDSSGQMGSTITIDQPFQSSLQGTFVLQEFWRGPANARRNIAARVAGTIEFYPTGNLNRNPLGSITFSAAPEPFLLGSGTLYFNFPNPTMPIFLRAAAVVRFSQSGPSSTFVPVGALADSSRIIENDPTVAANLPWIVTFMARNNYRANSQTIAGGFVQEYAVNASVGATGSGALTLASHASFSSAVTTVTGGTLTQRFGFQYADTGGTGTTTRQDAISIPFLSGATTNIGFLNGSTTVLPATTQAITSAASTITPNASIVHITNATGAGIILTGTPQVLPGLVDGQMLTIMLASTSGADVAVTLQDNNYLASSGIVLAANHKTLWSFGDTITLRWNAFLGVWFDVAPSQYAVRQGPRTQNSTPNDYATGIGFRFSTVGTFNDNLAFVGSNVVGKSFFGPAGAVHLDGVETFGRTQTFEGFTHIGMTSQIVSRNDPASSCSAITPAWDFISGRMQIADTNKITLNTNDTRLGFNAFVDNTVYATVHGGIFDGGGGDVPIAATTVNGSPTVTAAVSGSFFPEMLRRPIAGPGIPANTYVGVVTDSQHIGLSSSASSNVPVNAGAAAGAGFVRTTGNKYEHIGYGSVPFLWGNSRIHKRVAFDVGDIYSIDENAKAPNSLFTYLTSLSGINWAGITFGDYGALLAGLDTIGSPLVDYNIGVRIPPLQMGTYRVGVWNGAGLVHEPLAFGVTSGTQTILPYAALISTGNNSGSTITMTSTPTIAAGASEGQILELIHVGPQPIVLQDTSVLANSGLKLGSPRVTLVGGTVIRFIFSAFLGGWVQDVTGAANIGNPISVVDGVAAHGETLISTGVVFGTNASGVGVYANANDLFTVVRLVQLNGVGLVQFGGGGSTNDVDVTISRPAAQTLRVSTLATGSTFQVVDGTAAHGMVIATVGSGGPGVFFYKDSGVTTNPQVGLSSAFGLVFGDGTNAVDWAALRSAANTVTVTGTTLFNGAIGYAPGTGGTVPQSTSKSTGVTLNKLNGQITMNNQALASSASTGFTLTNSMIAATDAVYVWIVSGGSLNSYVVQVDTVAAGSCHIHVRNVTIASLSQALVLGFVVIKGVVA